MATARAIFQAFIDDFPAAGDPTVVNATHWTIASAAIRVETVTLNSGDNTLTVPTGATLLEVIPPTTNAQALKLKGNAADTGWQIATTAPTVLTLGGAVGTRIVNAGGSVAGCVLRWY